LWRKSGGGCVPRQKARCRRGEQREGHIFICHLLVLDKAFCRAIMGRPCRDRFASSSRARFITCWLAAMSAVRFFATRMTTSTSWRCWAWRASASALRSGRVLRPRARTTCALCAVAGRTAQPARDWRLFPGEVRGRGEHAQTPRAPHGQETSTAQATGSVK